MTLQSIPERGVPLSNMDMLVGVTASHSMFAFVDGFHGCTQINVHPHDLKNTSFKTFMVIFITQS